MPTDAELRLENARLRARIDHPSVPEHLLSVVQDPDQVATYARELSEYGQSQQAVVKPETWDKGVPMPPANATQAVTPEEEMKYQRVVNQSKNNAMKRFIDPADLVKVASSGPHEMGEAFARMWNRHIDQRRNGRGDF